MIGCVIPLLLLLASVFILGLVIASAPLENAFGGVTHADPFC
jgi:hypothetical protein